VSIIYILLTIRCSASCPPTCFSRSRPYRWITDSPRTTYIRDYNACRFYKSVCTERNGGVEPTGGRGDGHSARCSIISGDAPPPPCIIETRLPERRLSTPAGRGSRRPPHQYSQIVRLPTPKQPSVSLLMFGSRCSRSSEVTAPSALNRSN